MAKLHTLQPKTSNKRDRRIGRGGKRGTTSGRGTKGQLARSGHKLRPELRDIIKKLPKRRGYGADRMGVKPMVVNVEILEKNFDAGALVSPTTLLDKKLVRRIDGKMPIVKILGTGALTKELMFENCDFSAGARAIVEKAGGKIAEKKVKAPTKVAKVATGAGAKK